MKALMILFSLLAVSFAADNDVCYQAFVSYCKIPPEENNPYKDCSASYGGIKRIMTPLIRYANAHIAISFDYLLLSSNFGSYKKDRKGLEKLFRHLSDSTWEDGIDLIKHISKRGGSMDFNVKFNDTESGISVSQYNEIAGLAHALDNHKELARMSYELHEEASKVKDHEPEVASYLEKNFLHRHADIIRSLSGHIKDLSDMISYPEIKSVSLFIFDEYLRNHQ